MSNQERQGRYVAHPERKRATPRSYKSHIQAIRVGLLVLNIVMVLVLLFAYYVVIPRIPADPQVSISRTRTPTVPSSPTPTPTSELATPAPTPILVSAGRLKATYPLEMVAGHDEVVTLEILANPQITQIGAHPVHVTGVISLTTSSRDKRRRFEDQVKLYPVMSAELISKGFDVKLGDADPRRLITPGHSAAWTWSILASEPGIHQITINVFGEARIDEEKFTVLVVSRSFDIQVLEKPLHRRIWDNLVSDFATVITAVIGTGGPLGLIIAYLKNKWDQERDRLKARVDRLEGALQALQQSDDAEQRPHASEPA